MLIEPNAMNAIKRPDYQYGWRLRLLALIVANLWAILPVYGEENEISLKARFLKEAPQAWAEYSELTRKLQGSIKLQFSSSFTNAVGQNEYELKANENGKLISVIMERSSNGKRDYLTWELFGYNPTYSFAMRKNSPTSAWLTREIYPNHPTKEPAHIRKHFEAFAVVAAALVHMRHDKLTDIVRLPEFHVIHIRPMEDSGEQLIEVAFVCQHTVSEGSDKPLIQVQEGTLVLDPKRHWCLRSYDARTDIPNSRGTLKFRVLESGTTETGLLIPKKTVDEAEYVFDQGKNVQVHRFEYALTDPPELPCDDEFTLTAFGFSEPTLEAAQRSHWYGNWRFIAAIGAVASLALVIASQRWRRPSR